MERVNTFIAIPACYEELELHDLNVKPCKRKSSGRFTSGQQSHLGLSKFTVLLELTFTLVMYNYRHF